MLIIIPVTTNTAVRVKNYYCKFHEGNTRIKGKQNLNFEKHVTKKCGECYARLKALWKFKFILPKEIKWNLVNALVLSYLDFGSTVYYSFLSNRMKHRLQVLQNCCLRYSFLLPYTDHVTPHYNRLSILKLEHRFAVLYGTLLYNVIHTGQPVYLYNFLVKRSEVVKSNITLRGCELYSIPQHKTTKFESCFEYVAPKLLNSYMNSFTKPNIAHFKLHFKSKLKNIQNSPPP